MASLERRGDRFRIIIRFQGEKFQHSLATGDVAEAEACLKRVEANLHDLQNGRIVLPKGADLAMFLLSDGKQLDKALLVPETPTVTLGDLAERYKAAHATAVEADSIKTIAIHLRHLGTTLGTDFPIASLTRDDLQRHIDRRKSQRGRGGKPLSEKTIRKELMTLGAAWEWASGTTPPLTTGVFPKAGLKYPKGTEKPRFATRAEIERTIGRGGLGKTEEADLWSRLYLTQTEIDDFLSCVKERARPAWLYPMVALAAHTGARRSEILRARLSDIDLESCVITIRELKRLKGAASTRVVPLSSFLAKTLSEWLAAHPGGKHLFSAATTTPNGRPKVSPVTRDEAHHHLKHALAGSTWSVVKGYHVLRHTFISTCAAKGIDQRTVQNWVGHMTPEMLALYTHVSPGTSRTSMDAVFG